MPEYEWILCKSPSFSAPFAPLEKIGTLHNAKQRQFELVKNRAGSASFQIRTNDDAAYEILDQVNLNDVRGTVRKCIRIRRNKVDLWSGPIWGIQGSLDQGTITVNCVGWLETLQHQILESTLDYSNSGNGTPTDQIAYGLLNAVNAQDTLHPLWVQQGTASGVMPIRNRFYVLGQNLGQGIQELSDIEAGVDISVDPVTRALNLAAWDLYKSTSGWWGQVRSNIKLGYRWGPNNLKNFSWQESVDKMTNRIIVVSQGAPIGAQDNASLDEYGRFSEYDTITDANQTILPAYANAELAVRSRPIITYNIVPFPRGTANSLPSLFDDFQIGDKIYLTATKDAFRVQNQAVRIFGATVQLDDVGNETVSNLMTSPST
jgi:hypothetical protein